MISLRSKIVGAIVISSLMISIAIATISLVEASKIIENETNDKFKLLSENYAYNFSQRLIEVESAIDTLSASIEEEFIISTFKNDQNYRTELIAKNHEVVKSVGQNIERIYGIYFIVNPELTGEIYESWFVKDKNNNFIYQEPEDISEFYPENENVEWYYSPVEAKTGIWFEPYVDATINVNMISYTKAIFQDNQLIGVVGIDMRFEDIQQTIDDMQIYETGYAFLLNDQFEIMIHPTIEVGTRITEIPNEDLYDVEREMKVSSSSVFRYDYQNQKKTMGFSKLSNGWILGIAVVNDELLKPVTSLSVKIILMLVIFAPIIVVIGLKLAKSITAPIVRLKELATEISNGNHDIKIDMDFSHEIGALANSFVIMTKKLVTSHKDLKIISEDLEFLAYHDVLTSLPNRRFAILDLNQMIEHAETKNGMSGIMLIDIDDFKFVNDTYGHDMGDKLLKRVSRLLKECMRSEDTVYRIGGDEFMIIFTDITSLEKIEQLAKRINDIIANKFIFTESEFSVTCSIGLAVLSEEITKSDVLFKYADIALYVSKEKGKNTFSIYDDSDSKN